LRVVALASLRVSRADVHTIAVTLLPGVLIPVVSIAISIITTFVSIISAVPVPVPPLSLSV
jgi:hypothetical protein